MEERAEETREEEEDQEATEGEEKREGSLMGPYLLLDFLTNMLEKDFGIWWREWRRSEVGGSEHLVTYPLFFYMFGGDRKNVVTDLSKSVVSLYKKFLKHEHWALPQVSQVGRRAGSAAAECYTGCFFYWSPQKSLSVEILYENT